MWRQAATTEDQHIIDDAQCLINETTSFKRGFNMHLLTQDFFDELLSSTHPHFQIATFLNAAEHIMFPFITVLLFVQPANSGKKNAINSVLPVTLPPFYEGQSSNTIIM